MRTDRKIVRFDALPSDSPVNLQKDVSLNLDPTNWVSDRSSIQCSHSCSRISAMLLSSMRNSESPYAVLTMLLKHVMRKFCCLMLCNETNLAMNDDNDDKFIVSMFKSYSVKNLLRACS